MSPRKFAMFLSVSILGLSMLAVAPTASACTIDLGSCSAGDCLVNGVGSTCSGDCTVNGVFSNCGTAGRCLINGVFASCNGNCPLNIILTSC